MATHIPAKVRAAGLAQFIVRATQLETAKPVIAYWCKLLRPMAEGQADDQRRILDRESDSCQGAAQWR